MTRQLDYCACRALVGKSGADALFERVIPGDIDMDHVGDQVKVDSIVRDCEEQERKCAVCHDRDRCEPV